MTGGPTLASMRRLGIDWGYKHPTAPDVGTLVDRIARELGHEPTEAQKTAARTGIIKGVQAWVNRLPNPNAAEDEKRLRPWRQRVGLEPKPTLRQTQKRVEAELVELKARHRDELRRLREGHAKATRQLRKRQSSELARAALRRRRKR
jgi:hypothetical protein